MCIRDSAGTCCTLVTRDQAKHFKEMLLHADRHPTAVHLEIGPTATAAPLGPPTDRDALLPSDVSRDGGEPEPPLALALDEASAARAAWIRRYERALRAVQRVLELERRGLLAMHEWPPDDALIGDDDDGWTADAPGEQLVDTRVSAAGAVGGAAHVGDGGEAPLRRDRAAHLTKLMREQLVARAAEGRAASKRSRKRESRGGAVT